MATRTYRPIKARRHNVECIWLQPLLPGLLNLIDALRHTAIPQVAQHLLDNPTVRTSRAALEALANLEDTAHANYALIRAEAARLLAELDA